MSVRLRLPGLIGAFSPSASRPAGHTGIGGPGASRMRRSACRTLRGPSCLALVVITLMSACRTMPRGETGFLDRSLTLNGTTYPYVVYVPRMHERSERTPVVLVLHGAGERGSDGLKQMQIGYAAALRANVAPSDWIAVFPQAPAGSRWIGDPAAAALTALDRAIAEFHGDADRVVLTGLSMGGYGVWHLALGHPRRFRALIAVCGGLLPHPATDAVQRSPLTASAADPYALAGRALRDVPVWLFHGEKDLVIPVEESRRLFEHLKAAGNGAARYTEYPGVTHNSWDRAYREVELWKWLRGVVDGAPRP